VKHRAASGNPAHYRNLVLGYPIQIDLRKRILMLSHDNAGAVLPEHENIILKIFQHIFFSSKVEVRIGDISLNTKHL
jgi:hypothetical protein